MFINRFYDWVGDKSSDDAGIFVVIGWVVILIAGITLIYESILMVMITIILTLILSEWAYVSKLRTSKGEWDAGEMVGAKIGVYGRYSPFCDYYSWFNLPFFRHSKVFSKTRYINIFC